MKRMHVMLGVKNLDESVKFYSALFDSAPTVSKSDYAKWMLEDPRVNFSIAEKAGAHGIEHLGIQAESAAELEQLRARIARAGGVVRNEGETHVLLCELRQDMGRRRARSGVGRFLYIGCR